MYTSSFVHFVDPALVNVDYKNNVITEAAESVHGRHCDNEAEEVVDDCV